MYLKEMDVKTGSLYMLTLPLEHRDYRGFKKVTTVFVPTMVLHDRFSERSDELRRTGNLLLEEPFIILEKDDYFDNTYRVMQGQTSGVAVGLMEISTRMFEPKMQYYTLLERV